MECELPGSEASGFCFLMKLNCGQCVYDYHFNSGGFRLAKSGCDISDSPGIGIFCPLALLIQIKAEQILLAFQNIDEPW